MAKVKKSEGAESIEELNEEVSNEYFVEYNVKINIDEKGKRSIQKLDISRPKVIIREEEADTLNSGILNGPNVYAKMYFKPE